MKTSITVITASAGNPHLKDAIESVQQQNLNDDWELEHLIVVDGPEYEAEVRNIVEKIEHKKNITVHVLPYNTGSNGYLCHRIYGALPFLVNTDYVAFLDDDNIVEPNHIRSLLECMKKKGSRWSYTLRKIVDQDNTFLCNDTVESLGMIRPTCLGTLDRLIDTNCFLFERELAVNLAPLWHVKTRDAKPEGKLEADRQITQTLIQSEPSGACTREFTLRYRIGNREDSVSKEFFERGFEETESIDLNKQDLYLFFHADTETTEAMRSKNILVEKLKEMFNVLNGYDSIRGLPSDALVVCVIADPFQYLDTLRKLKQYTHKNMKRVVILTKKIDLPTDFKPVYADIALTSELDLTMTRVERHHGICANDNVGFDIRTNDGENVRFKCVASSDIDHAWKEGYIPLAWKGGDTELNQEIMRLEGSDWIDVSRSEAYCDKNGINGTKDEKILEFLKMNHYLNDDIGKIMHDRISKSIDDGIQRVVDVITRS